MPHSDTIPVSASIASTGLGIRYIGNWVYGISGVVSIDNTEASALEGTTNTGIIIGTVQFFSDQNAGDDYVLRIYYNDQAVVQARLSATHDTAPYGYYPINVVVPPLTNFKVTLDNVTDTSFQNWTILLTGRVYGAE